MTGPLISTEQRAAEREAATEAFSRLPLGDLLLVYQASTLSRLRAGTALLVIEKSRRIGLTWGLAAGAVLEASRLPSSGGQNAWYMGYDQEMAREFIDVCAMWAKVFNLAADAVDEELIESEERGVIGAFRIRFASGFKIVALPSVPRALRGKQGIVIIDEAAFHKDLDEVIKAALALLMWGGQVVVVSTHDGIGNPFNELCDEVRSGRRRGEVITITLADALAQGLYERIAMVAGIKGRSLPGKDEWEAEIRASYGDAAEEELDCVPRAGSGSLIKPEDIAAAEHADAGKPELYAGGLYFGGRDVARRRDGAVQSGLELVGDVMWERDFYDKIGATFADQDAWMDQRFADRRVVQFGIDQTGMGEKVVEDAKLRWGERIVGFLLTGPMRLTLGLALLDGFERGLVRIPPDPRRRADLRAIKRAATSGGGVRLVNDDSVHADYFWALAIGFYLSRQPLMAFDYRTAAPPRTGGGSRRLSMRPRHDDDLPARVSRGTW